MSPFEPKNSLSNTNQKSNYDINTRLDHAHNKDRLINKAQIVTVLSLPNTQLFTKHNQIEKTRRATPKVHDLWSYIGQAHKGGRGGLGHFNVWASTKPQGPGMLRELSKRLHREQVSKCPRNYSKSYECGSALELEVCSFIYDFPSSKLHIFILSN